MTRIKIDGIGSHIMSIPDDVKTTITITFHGDGSYSTHRKDESPITTVPADSQITTK